MRHLVIAVLLFGLTAPAFADVALPSREMPTEKAPDKAPEKAPAEEAPADEVPAPKKHVNPTELMRERQQIEQAGGGGRSGFWTSRQPAQGGAYRWRLLGIGLGLIVIMGAAIVVLIRRANRANLARRTAGPPSDKPTPA